MDVEEGGRAVAVGTEFPVDSGESEQHQLDSSGGCKYIPPTASAAVGLNVPSVYDWR